VPMLLVKTVNKSTMTPSICNSVIKWHGHSRYFRACWRFKTSL